jgi:RNA recognition motif-containing protein
MADEKDAKDAVDATHGTELDGRTLKVEISQNRPREERRGGDDRRRDDRGGRNGGGGGGRGICYDFQNGNNFLIILN